MSKRAEIDANLSRADIDTYREWVAGVVGLDVSELTTDRWNKRSSVEKRRVAAYLLRSALPGHLLIRDVAIIMKKSEPWVTKSIHYIQQCMSAHYIQQSAKRRAFRDTIKRMTAEYEKFDGRLTTGQYLLDADDAFHLIIGRDLKV